MKCAYDENKWNIMWNMHVTKTKEMYWLYVMCTWWKQTKYNEYINVGEVVAVWNAHIMKTIYIWSVTLYALFVWRPYCNTNIYIIEYSANPGINIIILLWIVGRCNPSMSASMNILYTCIGDIIYTLLWIMYIDIKYI